jgi:hypothetical protein
MERPADWTCRDVKNDYPAVRVVNLLRIYPQSDSVKESGFCLGEVRECVASDHATRWLIAHSENDLASTFVCQSDTVFHQVFVAPPLLGFFELEMFTLSRDAHPFFQLGGVCRHVVARSKTPKASARTRGLLPRTRFLSPRIVSSVNPQVGIDQARCIESAQAIEAMRRDSTPAGNSV